jgi:dihydrofolate reductase
VIRKIDAVVPLDWVMLANSLTIYSHPPELVGYVAELTARGVRHAYVDGGITIQQFLRAGLIQRLIITRVPVLIGTGIPLFGATGRDIALTHVATRHCPSGLVQTEYEIVS